MVEAPNLTAEFMATNDALTLVMATCAICGSEWHSTSACPKGT